MPPRITMVQFNCPVWRLPIRRLEELLITANLRRLIYLAPIGCIARGSQDAWRRNVERRRTHSWLLACRASVRSRLI